MHGDRLVVTRKKRNPIQSSTKSVSQKSNRFNVLSPLTHQPKSLTPSQSCHPGPTPMASVDPTNHPLTPKDGARILPLMNWSSFLLWPHPKPIPRRIFPPIFFPVRSRPTTPSIHVALATQPQRDKSKPTSTTKNTPTTSTTPQATTQTFNNLDSATKFNTKVILPVQTDDDHDVAIFSISNETHESTVHREEDMVT